MDQRFKRCPGCKKKILIDTMQCTCGWRADGAPRRCACGNAASIYADGKWRCSTCAREVKPADGPGYAGFKAKLEEMRRGRAREPGDDDEELDFRGKNVCDSRGGNVL